MRNIYRSLLLVIAGATQKELARHVRYHLSSWLRHAHHSVTSIQLSDVHGPNGSTWPQTNLLHRAAGKHRSRSSHIVVLDRISNLV